MAKLTEWEERHVHNITLLLGQANDAVKYFEDREKELGPLMDISQDWLKFRSFVYDLSSVLDYTWYLLYCHFSKGGQPDLSDKATEYGFPFIKKGVKVSRVGDFKRTFLRKKLRMLWGRKDDWGPDMDMFGQETHFWRGIGELVYSVQSKLPVDDAGIPMGGLDISDVDQQSFAMLHFYRNCATHRDLVMFASEKTWVEINLVTREKKIVTKNEGQPGYFYKEISKAAYWTQLPEIIPLQAEDTCRYLLEVMVQLKDFVKTVASKLFQFSLIPPNSELLTIQHFERFPRQITMKRSPYYTQIIASFAVKMGCDDMTVETKYPEKENPEIDLRFSVIQKCEKKLVFNICSRKHPNAALTKNSYQQAKEAAAEEVTEECVRLGLLVLI